MTVVGRGVAAAAGWLGARAAAAFRAVDPDLRRHAAQLPLVALTQLAPSPGRAEALPDDGHCPVIFVPGLGGGPGNFLPMRLYFRLMGRSRTYVMAFSGRWPLEERAAHLGELVEEVVVANGLGAEDQLDLVAHSMGGLVARLTLEESRVCRRIATLVTLGTPHRGSHLARYGATTHSLELRPGSPLLARLARQLPWPGPPAMPRLVCLWSAADVILLPAESAAAEGADCRELAGFTHYEYLIHPAGWRATFEALADE
jgi:pimeloyl-ACP methyl ester carboxylesterase